jgi:hypothetical protein
MPVILLVIFITVFFSVSTVLSANLDVCKSGCAYSSIQSALDTASDGDVVRVAQRWYFENIFINDTITVDIQGGWKSDFSSRSSDPSLTVVNGLTGTVFDFFATKGIAIDVTIEGITITELKSFNWTSYVVVSNFNNYSVNVACQFTNFSAEQTVKFYTLPPFGKILKSVKEAAGAEDIFDIWCTSGDITGTTVLVLNEKTGEFEFLVPMVFFFL